MTTSITIKKLIDLIVKSGVVKSKNEVRRLLDSGAIKRLNKEGKWEVVK